MGKKARVYNPGDYVFAKVKGYPAWPAKIVSLNGKKYNIYFFGTGESGNLPANDIFDYFEHKQKFLEKVLKRRDYNEGLAQIEHETNELGLTSNGDKADVTLDTTTEQNDTVYTPNESTAEVEADLSVNNTTVPETEPTVPEVAKVPKKRGAETPNSSAQPPAKTRKIDEQPEVEPEIQIDKTNSTDPSEDAVNQTEKDSEETQIAKEAESADSAIATEPATSEDVVRTVTSGRGRKPSVKTANSTPRAPRKSIKQEVMSPVYEPHVPVPESVSRSGRKIKPKRYLDEETAETPVPATPAKKIKTQLSSPNVTPTGAEDDDSVSPSAAAVDAPVPAAVPMETPTETPVRKGRKKAPKQQKLLSIIAQNDLEKFVESFNDEDGNENNANRVLPAVLPSGKIVGIKLVMDCPEFNTPEAKQQWQNTFVLNISRLKQELENGHLLPTAIPNKLEMDLNLPQDEVQSLKQDKEMEIKRKKIAALKVEQRLLEIEKSIRSTLGYEAADTDHCLQLLDELSDLPITKVMLLKNSPVVTLIKRVRQYVGNLDQWKLSEEETEKFKESAKVINKKAQSCYEKFKWLFDMKNDDAFRDYYSQQLVIMKMLYDSNDSREFLELIDDPPEISQPNTFNVLNDDSKDKIKGKKEAQSNNKIKSESKNDVKLSIKKTDGAGKSPKREKAIQAS
ncbi:JIL-1 anchoring and stabilizing protein [Arctopsyche grandis]|uniref:JIL-1 anchoring and stabilizing protein n=1 Tax=Arctopsyche grandis TaxID=121162 RepID=UPI00406D6612